MLGRKEQDYSEINCNVIWALYRLNYNKSARIKYMQFTEQIQMQHYSLVLTTLSVNYMQLVQLQDLPQMEEYQEHYLRVDLSVHHGLMEDDYCQVYQEHQDYQMQDIVMVKDYLQDNLAVSNYRRPRTLQAPIAWTSGATSASN